MSDVVIRAAQYDDYQDVHDILSCPGVVRNTMTLPYVSLDRRRDREMNQPPGTHILVAEIGDRVIGYLTLRQQTDRRSHVAELMMAVHDDHQGQGIGTLLFEAAMDLVDNWLNIKRVELQVYTDNEPGVRLYKRFGFEIEGTNKAIAFREGEYVDAYYMARLRM